jgi:hypothetical protein
MNVTAIIPIITFSCFLKNFLRFVCCIQEKVILLQAINKDNETMNMLNAYFYGYYFYFAANCEAEGRM